MKKALKIAGWILAGLVVLALAGAGYVQLAYNVDFPRTPLPAISARSDAATIARGEYLVNAVAHCSTCHGPKEIADQRRVDFTQPLSGGHTFVAGPFGRFTAKNLTPHADGIGGLSDGEIARVVRHGVDRRGKLSPFMRIAVGPMSDEDLTAIISYLRAQPAVPGKWPEYELGFIGKVVALDFTPRLTPPPAHVPEGGVSIERGRYLAEGPAACAGCHTPVDPMNGFAFDGPLMSGSTEADPDPTDSSMVIQAPNLTPDRETGHIAAWSEDHFVGRFRAGRAFRGSKMPWEAYQRLTEDDLRSLYRYLMSLPPTRRAIGATVRKG